MLAVNDTASSKTQVKGRFAPSPSGRMHFGNIFSAVLAYASARSQGGSFIVRLEDADARCQNPLNTQLLLEDLAWLGLDWDEEPLAQRNRSSAYEEALELLKTKARLYPCFCSRADLHAASAPHASDGTPVYAGTCRDLNAKEIAERRKLKVPALRIQVPEREISFVDACRGAYAQNLAQGCGDFVVQRADGCFAYQLAVVVDDAMSGVTEVVRGGDLISSTPRQIWLNELLGNASPTFVHHPVLLACDGKRLSKREKSLDMGVMRQRCTRQELLGRIAFLAGFAAEEKPMSLEELVAEFAWSKVPAYDITLDTLEA